MSEERIATPASLEPGGWPPSDAELNLLMEWPPKRSAGRWATVLGGSVLLHIFLFVLAIQIPSLVGQRAPEREVIVHRIPLYLPRDIMTQRTPNKAEPKKQIDLADLAASERSQPSPGRRQPSFKHFEVPKQAPQRKPVKASPQILPEAPTLALNQTATPPAGAPGGLPVPAPPPAPAPTNPSPFQNIGAAPPPNPHPKLAPPKATVQSAVNGLVQSMSGQNLVISDDVPEIQNPLPGSSGSMSQAPAQHAAVELESDPNGADFREYLRQILTIVRSNWRRVIPESARMGMLRGRTVVEFAINRDGSIPKLVTADTSGSQPLDRAAVAGLSMSNPLPPLPADYKGFQVRLAFTFAYNMPSK